MSGYKWKPIEPLSEKERTFDLISIRSLYESWKGMRTRLTKSNPESLKRFTDRLSRRLSVETGILEQIYDLDRGTTEALVAHGFAEELVSRSSTDIEPGRLIDILRDQEAATQLVMDCVARKRELTVGLVHELHSVLMKHQDTTTAIDQFGKRFDIPLLKGRFKHQSNNPKRPDGTLHEYCPPIQVPSEMDNLLKWLKEYEAEDPVIVGTWLHHRFTQIHPYQDGNGRVGRTLITLVLLRSDLLPLVIDRDLRAEYIKALEEADFGDLTKLATLFARLERAAILKALSVDLDAEISQEQTLTSAVIKSLASKFDRRKHAKNAELRKVNALAEQLRYRTRQGVASVLNDLKRTISLPSETEIHIQYGGPDQQNAHYYKYQVSQSASEAGKYVNFDESHYFIKATISVDHERLLFVTSFHHVGRELSGIMEATAFAQLETCDGSDDRKWVSHDFFVCSLEQFVFTYLTIEGEIGTAFDRWLDTALAVAIKEFGDRL